MNAKTELASRILMLVYDEVRPDTQRILDVLQDYKVEYSSGLEDADFNRQIIHFLGAKKSEGMSPKSAINYRLYLGMIADYVNKKPSEVTTNDIRDFIMYLGETRKLTNTSIQSVINILRSFFGWLHIEELIPKNPMVRIKSFSINRKDARHPLTVEEMEKLRDTCKTYREKALVEFMYSTGCRLSEITQLDFNSLDFAGRSAEVIGKGNKPRTVYFSVRARLMLQSYEKERKGGTALFCRDRKPYTELKGRSIQKLVAELGRRAGIARRLHPHVLRHTFATHMLNSGMDITVIQRLLGHSSVGTTEIYAEINQDSIKREYEKYVA